MADSEDIKARIDSFFDAVADKEADRVSSFVDKLFESYCKADQSAQRQTIGFMLAWAVLFAIDSGLVSEAQITSFKIENVRYLLIIGPPILGLLAYTLSAAWFASVNLGAATGRCYKHLLPEAHNLDLELLIGPPTALRVERTLRSKEGKIHHAAGAIMFILTLTFCVLGMLAAIAHAALIVWNLGALPSIVRATSVGFGLVFWIRSVLIWSRTGSY